MYEELEGVYEEVEEQETKRGRSARGEQRAARVEGGGEGGKEALCRGSV